MDSMGFLMNFEEILRDLKDFASFVKRFFETFRISDEFSWKEEEEQGIHLSKSIIKIISPEKAAS